MKGLKITNRWIVVAGAILIQDIKEEPWGQTTSYVTDSNGFLIEICSPVKSQS